jgi:hypothetical protein
MKKVIYVIGGFLLFCAIMLLTNGDTESYVGSVMFFALSLIFLPTFDILCKLINKEFSLGRKIALGFGTLMLPAMGATTEEAQDSYRLRIAIGVIILYWIAMFITDKKTYVNKENKEYIKTSEKNDIFHRLYNKIVEKHNAKVRAILEYEQEIKNNFTHLDVLTMNTIAKMVSENKARYNSIYNQNMPETDISKVILSFCKDSQRIENEYELDILYTRKYYINKINNDCSQLSDFIKARIKETLPRQNKKKYIAIYNRYINIFADAMNTHSKIKFYRMITSNQNEELSRYKDYGINTNIDFRYKDSLIYLIDILTTCTCIAKMVFIERKVAKLDETNEFYKIIYNMTKEIKDIDTIIKKSRPIYDEFYKSNLGFIDDELNYDIAITIIVNKINNKNFSNKDETILDIGKRKTSDYATYDMEMRKWISYVADKYRNIDIDVYIVYKTINLIELSNFELLFKTLAMVNEYSESYYYKVEHNNKETDRERYLKGDFEKEKKELSGKYSLNNITTGTQFELYLVNLFKDLGYKAKHNGKSGDQGADLILKKGDYVYAVQAKYYTGKLSNTPVQEIVGALKYYNANQGVVVTNSDFTPGAEELAKANNIILIDGKDLKKLTDYTFEEDHSEDVLKKFEK